MKLLFLITCVFLALDAYPQHEEPLLDEIAIMELTKEPYGNWYNDGFANYEVDKNFLGNLKKEAKNINFEIYLGTWCGDSRREVPRFLKLASEMGVSSSRISLIGVDISEGSYKQSPSKTERDLGIYRVPTFRVLNQGKEIGRIVEYPVESLESDLLSILTEKGYDPNYKSFPFIDDWINSGVLAQPNVSIRGLANQLRNQVYHFSEINAVAHVLMDQGKAAESLLLYRINAYLFRDNASCQVMLARAYHKTGDITNALKVYRKAWELEPGDDTIFDELVAVAGDL